MYEFCCDQNSAFGEVGPEKGVSVVRLCRDSIDLSDASAIEQLMIKYKGHLDVPFTVR